MKPPKRLPLLASLVLLAASTRAEIVERVVARVNGDIVTLSDFEARQIAEVQGARVPPERVEAYLRENNARILQDAIDDVLLLQRADDLGIRLRPEYIQEVIEGIKKENKIESDQELERQLRQEGMTLSALKRNIERSIVRRQVLSRELENRSTVTEAEARADYEARKADFTRSASVSLQEILVPAGQTELARSLIERARAGEDFAELARRHSMAPSKTSGGELGRLNRGEMNPALEAAAFALHVGGVSAPLTTPQGLRIIKVLEKTEDTVVPFETARADILKRLGQERMSKTYEAYVEGLRKGALIKVTVSEVPLQVSAPAPGSVPLQGLNPDASPASPASPVPGLPGVDPSEISTTPQASPERVVPQALPMLPPASAPAPSPSPSPR